MPNGNGSSKIYRSFSARSARRISFPSLTRREEWQVLVTVTPQERALMFSGPMPMAEFRNRFWNKAFGGGDPLRDLAPGLDRSVIEAIVTGDLRRRKPYWANCESAAPCTYYCPIHIPTVDRLRLIREGQIDEAYEMILRLCPPAGFGLRVGMPEPLHGELLPPRGRRPH